MKRITNTYKVTKLSRSMGNSSITSVYSSENGDYCLKQESAQSSPKLRNQVSIEDSKFKSKGKKKIQKKILRKVATQKELEKPSTMVNNWSGQLKNY